MSDVSRRMLFWTPRVLSIIFIAFLSIFALDVFDGQHGLWQVRSAFLIHEIPVFVLLAALILAWRWEWVGTLLYSGLALLYVGWVMFMQHHIPPPARLGAILIMGGPAFVIAGLFLANWLRHDELRATRH